MSTPVPGLIRPARILILGEAPGEQETMFQCPFVGAAGQELYRMLAEAGLVAEQTNFSSLTMKQYWEASDLALTNVFDLRPPDNKVEHFFGSKSLGNTSVPPLAPGKYVLPQYFQWSRLTREIELVSPELIIALGNTAAWAATCSTPKISKIRGFVHDSQFGPKVLPTFHPSAVLRQWSNRPVVVADLYKAKKILETKGAVRSRFVLIEPTLSEIEGFYENYLLGASCISYDIENPRGLIDCVGFADTAGHAICIPFIDERKPGNSYWPSAAEEIAAWNWVKKILQLPQPKVTQYGLYDIQHLWRQMGICPRNSIEDTLVLHHALQPEMDKSLGFQGSLYSDIPEWKSMRKSKGSDQAKKEG